MDCNENIALAYDRNLLDLWSSKFDDPLTAAETFILDSSNNLLEIGKKPTELDRIQMTQILQKIIESKWLKIKGIEYEGKRGEFDTQRDIENFTGS